MDFASDHQCFKKEFEREFELPERPLLSQKEQRGKKKKNERLAAAYNTGLLAQFPVAQKSRQGEMEIS